MPDFSYIYFAEAAQPPLIKIGTTEHPENRLNDLASGALQDLTVRAVLLGGRRMEQQVHDHFDHLRSHREWFHKTEELDRFVEGAPSITPPFVVTYTHRTKIDLEPLAIEAVHSGLDGQATQYVVEMTQSW